MNKLDRKKPRKMNKMKEWRERQHLSVVAATTVGTAVATTIISNYQQHCAKKYTLTVSGTVYCIVWRTISKLSEKMP